jgi:two-component system cell cycle response regulator
MEVGERLREAIATEAFRLTNGTSLWVTASVGVATLSFSTDTPQSMLKRADLALYRAKHEGRNRVAAAAA